MELIAEKYKQTEVGLIPSDWEVKKLGDVLKVIGGGAFKSRDATQAGVKWLKIANVGINQAVWDDESYLPLELIKDNENFLLKENDYVIALTRPILDRKLKIAKLNENDIPALLNQRVGKIEVESQTDIDFAYFLFQKFETINCLLQSMAGTDPPNLSNKGIYGIDCAIPPTKAEQTAIATALSDADALISSLEKLIAKKHNIKQGAMQKLLQPKEGWVVKKLGEIAEIYTGKKNNQDKVENGLYPFFVRSQTIERINTYSFDGEAILIPGEGNIGKIFHYINGKFDYHQRVYKISDFKSGYFSKYIYRYISEYFGRHAMENSVKATVDSLRLPTFQVFEIPFPPTYKEQENIATILSDMDAEINALETKLEKYRKVKLGMMQNLLTGKIRLV